MIVNGVYDRLGKLTGEDKEKYKGIPTGFGLLDTYITGLNKSDFILIGARPAMGKTSFALNLASNVSMMARKKDDQGAAGRAFAGVPGRCAQP